MEGTWQLTSLGFRYTGIPFLRKVEFTMAKLGRGRSYEEFRTFRLPVRNLCQRLRELDFNCGEVHSLLARVERDLSPLYYGKYPSWYRQLAHELLELQEELWIEERERGYRNMVGVEFS